MGISGGAWSSSSVSVICSKCGSVTTRFLGMTSGRLAKVASKNWSSGIRSRLSSNTVNGKLAEEFVVKINLVT